MKLINIAAVLSAALLCEAVPHDFAMQFARDLIPSQISCCNVANVCVNVTEFNCINDGGRVDGTCVPLAFGGTNAGKCTNDVGGKKGAAKDGKTSKTPAKTPAGTKIGGTGNKQNGEKKGNTGAKKTGQK